MLNQESGVEYPYFALLFGSRARGDCRPDSDVDVFITGAYVPHPDENNLAVAKTEFGLERLLEVLRPLSIEDGGKLDLFMDNGQDLLAAYSPGEALAIEGEELDWDRLMGEAKAISLDEIKRLARMAVLAVPSPPRTTLTNEHLANSHPSSVVFLDD